MRVSIAMCTYNGSRFLNQQLQSIAAQTLPPCELVICDDGSTDSTSHIVKSFAQAVAFPVRFIRNEATLGSTRNFEKAIRLCQGDTIALCDQDDVWQPGKLDTMASLLAAEPQVGGVFCNAGLIDESSRSLAGSLWHRSQVTPAIQAELNGADGAFLLLERRVVTGATLAFRANLVSQVTPIPSEWVHDAWIALIIAAVSRLRAIPEHLMSYRLHASQQVGLTPRRWYAGLQVDRRQAMATHKLAEHRWRSLAEKLETLPIDPSLVRLAQERWAFMQTRTALRQQKMADRVVGATLSLPKYFRFSQGLMSYGRDVAGA
jgi:glycosyltransferase involved in cell wall biosynthesis